MTRSVITLRELAKALDLSPTTVSRALNGFPEVNEMTRKRVEKLAGELGYRPNLSAKRLAHGVVGAIGLVLQKEDKGFIDPLLAEFLDGVSAHLAMLDVDLTLFASGRGDEVETYSRAIAQKTVDGFIVSAPSLADPRVMELARQRFPFVLHGRTDVKARYSYYDIDNFGGFEQATRLLLGFGHRNLAFIGGTPDARFASDRLSGTRSALAAEGLSLPAENVFYGLMTEKLGHEAGGRYFDMPAGERPSAFLCLSLYVALGLMRAGRERGLTCPRDYSLIVHDDRAPYLRAEFFDPPLTALQSSIRDGGIQVASMLLERVRGNVDDVREVVMPVELVQRRSVSRVPAT
ncbi:MAG: substrate-binding domain-containing protein [Geminicoccaceae bacterium]